MSIEKLLEKNKPTLDPRPDLTEDSCLWEEVFQAVKGGPKELYAVLRGFRGMGLRIVSGNGGGYVMRPYIDPSGMAGFSSQEDYEYWRDNYLKNHIKAITGLLKLLEQGRSAI